MITGVGKVFAATAVALHLTPSAVSQQLAGLAREVGAPLLEHRGRGVVLTGQARLLLSHADTVLEELDRTRAALEAWSGGTVGEVRVGSLSTGISALVAPALGRLHDERPGLVVRVDELEPAGSLRALDAGDLDVAVTVDHPGAPSRRDTRYHRVDLIADVMDALLPPDHRLAASSEVDLADLATDVWVGSAGNDACGHIVSGVCATAGFTPDVRHRCQEWDAVAALGAEIEAIISDPGPSGDGQPIRRHSARPWPLRTAAGLRDRVLHGGPWWRRALWYVLLGFPLAVWLPVEPGFLGLVAWSLLPAGVAFLRLWIVMAELDTRWVIRRRGITVRARYERDPHGEADHDHIVRFRTLEGREVTAHPATRGCREEIGYDPEDPSRVLAPTRVAWLGIALAAFMLTGIWGVALSIPAAIWLIRLLALPF